MTQPIAGNTSNNDPVDEDDRTRVDYFNAWTSSWAGRAEGDRPDPITLLLDLVGSYVLDRSMEPFREDLNPEHRPPHNEQVGYTGKFLHSSSVFRLTTSDPDLIAKLDAAIDANVRRSDYLDQPNPWPARIGRLWDDSYRYRRSYENLLAAHGLVTRELQQLSAQLADAPAELERLRQFEAYMRGLAAGRTTVNHAIRRFDRQQRGRQRLEPRET
jgi:hypothetical protein